MYFKSMVLCAAMLGMGTAVQAQPPLAKGLEVFQFVVGEWTGEGSGKPGQGSGSFSLAPDLEGKILIRHNRADYPAANGRPAISHRDLMVVYVEANEPRADYYDTEGHVIHYRLEAGSDSKKLALVSDAAANAPRYR